MRHNLARLQWEVRPWAHLRPERLLWERLLQVQLRWQALLWAAVLHL